MVRLVSGSLEALLLLRPRLHKGCTHSSCQTWNQCLQSSLASRNVEHLHRLSLISPADVTSGRHFYLLVHLDWVGCNHQTLSLLMNSCFYVYWHPFCSLMLLIDCRHALDSHTVETRIHLRDRRLLAKGRRTSFLACPKLAQPPQLCTFEAVSCVLCQSSSSSTCLRGPCTPAGN